MQRSGSPDVVGVVVGAEGAHDLHVVRRGDALPAPDTADLIGQDDRRFPARALGRVVLIDVGKDISIGLVDRAVEEMGVGDLVIMRKEVGVEPTSAP